MPPVLFQGRKILEQGRHKKIEHNNKSTNKLLFALNFSLAIAKYNPTSKLLTITQRLLNCLSCVLYVAILAVMASSSLHEHFIFVVWIFFPCFQARVLSRCAFSGWFFLQKWPDEKRVQTEQIKNVIAPNLHHSVELVC